MLTIGSRRLLQLVLAPRVSFGQSIVTLKREKENLLASKIKSSLHPTYVSVTDTTLGDNSCGQMYKIIVESPSFKGKTRVEQHQMVSDCLGEHLAQIHGFSLKTKVAEDPENTTKV